MDELCDELHLDRDAALEVISSAELLIDMPRMGSLISIHGAKHVYVIGLLPVGMSAREIAEKGSTDGVVPSDVIVENITWQEYYGKRAVNRVCALALALGEYRDAIPKNQPRDAKYAAQLARAARRLSHLLQDRGRLAPSYVPRLSDEFESILQKLGSVDQTIEQHRKRASQARAFANSLAPMETLGWALGHDAVSILVPDAVKKPSVREPRPNGSPLENFTRTHLAPAFEEVFGSTAACTPDGPFARFGICFLGHCGVNVTGSTLASALKDSPSKSRRGR